MPSLIDLAAEARVLPDDSNYATPEQLEALAEFFSHVEAALPPPRFRTLERRILAWRCTVNESIDMALAESGAL